VQVKPAASFFRKEKRMITILIIIRLVVEIIVAVMRVITEKK